MSISLDNLHVGSATQFVAKMVEYNKQREETLANTRLIAASPDLLAAAKLATSGAPEDWKYHDGEARLALVTAIAKAEGTS